MKNCFLIVFDGKIFEIWEGDVMQRFNFWASGSGMFLALSAMHFGKDTISAVEVEKKYDLFCGGETINFKVKI